MGRLNGSNEQTSLDPGLVGVAAWAAKRGHNGGGPRNLEIEVPGVDSAIVFGADERQQIVSAMDQPGPNKTEAVSSVIASLLVRKLTE